MARPVIIKGCNKGNPVWLDSAQYAAICRVRYRKWLAKRGLPQSIVKSGSTVRELRTLCVAILNAASLAKTEA